MYVDAQSQGAGFEDVGSLWTGELSAIGWPFYAHAQVTALDVTSDGKYLVTCGTDSKWKV